MMRTVRSQEGLAEGKKEGVELGVFEFEGVGEGVRVDEEVAVRVLVSLFTADLDFVRTGEGEFWEEKEREAVVLPEVDMVLVRFNVGATLLVLGADTVWEGVVARVAPASEVTVAFSEVEATEVVEL